MAKSYLARKKKKDPSIVRIFLGVFLVFILAYGALYATKNVAIPGTRAYLIKQAPDLLAKAKMQLENNQPEEASATIAPLIETLNDPVITPSALFVQAEIDLAQKDTANATKHLKLIVDQYKESQVHAQASVQYAELLAQQGKQQEATRVFKDLKETAPAQMKAEGLCGLAQQLEKEGKLIEARAHYRDALQHATPETELWNQALDALGNLNVTLIFSPMETPESKYYSVEKGDTITSIGVKFNTTQGLLLRANGIEDPSRLRLNQRLKYTPKDFRVIIERSTCRLFLLDQSGIFKRYYVGLGMPGHETTLGNYTIGSKQKDPVWYKPGASPVPAGDPDNELGTRWLPLVPADRGLPDDLGIHGTIAPETIGQYKSHGCPRMKNEDVEELYDLIVRATPVEIVDKLDNSFFNTISDSNQ